MLTVTNNYTYKPLDKPHIVAVPMGLSRKMVGYKLLNHSIMRNAKLDHFGLNYPYFYRVDVVRDATSPYVAKLGDTLTVTGCYTNNPDILFSKFLAITRLGFCKMIPALPTMATDMFKYTLLME